MASVNPVEPGTYFNRSAIEFGFQSVAKKLPPVGQRSISGEPLLNFALENGNSWVQLGDGYSMVLLSSIGAQFNVYSVAHMSL